MAKPIAKVPFWGTFLQLFDTMICPICVYQDRKNGGLFVFVFIRGAKRHYLALTGLLKKKRLQALTVKFCGEFIVVGANMAFSACNCGDPSKIFTVASQPTVNIITLHVYNAICTHTSAELRQNAKAGHGPPRQQPVATNLSTLWPTVGTGGGHGAPLPCAARKPHRSGNRVVRSPLGKPR